MRLRVFTLGALLALVLGAMVSRPDSRFRAAAASEDRICPGEVIVRLKPGRDVNRINSRYGTFVKGHIAGTGDYLLGLPPGEDEKECLNRIEKDKDLEFADANYIFELPEVRQTSQAFIDQVSQAFIDGRFPVNFYGQPSLANLTLVDAHRISRGAGVRVAVLDTGLDFRHRLFMGRIAGPYYDFVDNDLSPDDEPNGLGFGHGTGVAGLIALTAPDATLLPLRVFNREGVGTSYNIARAIRFAADNGAPVINMSFGLNQSDKLIEEAIKYAGKRAVFIASAGNRNQDYIEYPAERKDRTISVTSTTAKDIKAPFANYHKDIDVTSPGVSLYSAYPGERWAWWSGTSFSTALVSGEVALMLAIDRELEANDMKKILKDSGVKIDDLNERYKNKLGRRVDFRAAVDRARSKMK
ncbi:MAG: S8 family peptidase [Blastocatellia bacterium]